MKKTVVFLLFIFSLSNVFGQFTKSKNLPNYDNRLIHWGFTFGINKLDFIVIKSQNFYNAPSDDNLYGIAHKWLPGGHLGPIFEIRLLKFLTFRTLITLNFQQRSLIYYFNQGSAPLQIDIPSTFVQMPLLFKYHGARYGNMRPYIIAGAAPTFDISALKRPQTNVPRVYLSAFDTYGETGLGIDWFLQYFKLSTEIKFGRGLMNVLEPDNSVYTKYLQGLYSYYFMFSLHFEG
jgi:hypothetical protein